VSGDESALEVDDDVAQLRPIRANQISAAAKPADVLSGAQP
jgi:hypothetical protein